LSGVIVHNLGWQAKWANYSRQQLMMELAGVNLK
jgi:hypothetical protein